MYRTMSLLRESKKMRAMVITCTGPQLRRSVVVSFNLLSVVFQGTKHKSLALHIIMIISNMVKYFTIVCGDLFCVVKVIKVAPACMEPILHIACGWQNITCFPYNYSQIIYGMGEQLP